MSFRERRKRVKGNRRLRTKRHDLFPSAVLWLNDTAADGGRGICSVAMSPYHQWLREDAHTLTSVHTHTHTVCFQIWLTTNISIWSSDLSNGHKCIICIQYRTRCFALSNKQYLWKDNCILKWLMVSQYAVVKFPTVRRTVAVPLLTSINQTLASLQDTGAASNTHLFCDVNTSSFTSQCCCQRRVRSASEGRVEWWCYMVPHSFQFR